MSQLTIVGKVTLAGKVKCYYLPLVKLTNYLTKLEEGQGIHVKLDTKRFDIKPIKALAESYRAKVKVLRGVNGVIELLVYKGGSDGGIEKGLSNS